MFFQSFTRAIDTERTGELGSNVNQKLVAMFQTCNVTHGQCQNQNLPQHQLVIEEVKGLLSYK